MCGVSAVGDKCECTLCMLVGSGVKAGDGWYTWEVGVGWVIGEGFVDGGAGRVERKVVEVRVGGDEGEGGGDGTEGG